jgi:hypothetical protein
LIVADLPNPDRYRLWRFILAAKENRRVPMPMVTTTIQK